MLQTKDARVPDKLYPTWLMLLSTINDFTGTDKHLALFALSISDKKGDMAVHRMALSPNGLFTDRAVHRTPLLGALSPNAHSGKTMGFHRMHMFTERRRRWRRRGQRL